MSSSLPAPAEVEIAKPSTPLQFWGSFDEPQREMLRGVEKRLELDFRETCPDSTDWHVVLESVGLFIKGAMVNREVSCFLCDNAIVIVMPLKVIVTASREVAVHELAGPLVNTLEAMGVHVEWASFMRKNTGSPWQTNDKSMALEYAHLKSTFPSGNPFIFGQADADHYFYFVFDNILRGDPSKKESDVQFNLVMYGVNEVNIGRPHALFLPQVTSVYRTAAQTGGEFQGASFVGPGVYEHAKVGQLHEAVRTVSFETNAEMTLDTRARIRQLVNQLAPERFTAILLVDPQSETAAAIEMGADLGMSDHDFVDYTLVNRTLNEFSPGYFVLKMSFLKRAPVV